VIQPQINATVKRERFIFPPFIKKCQVNTTNESYSYIDKSGF